MSDTPRYPEYSSDKFYKQFSNPERAYWNLPGLYNMYISHLEYPYPENELEHVNYAWKDAHRDDTHMPPDASTIDRSEFRCSIRVNARVATRK